jgi:hypothetical protein
MACWNSGTISTGNVPLSNSGSSLEFAFPVIANFDPGTDQGSINYLRTNFTNNLSGGSCNYQGSIVAAYCLTMTFQIVTTGAPVFNWDLESGNNCTSNCNPGTVRFLLEHAGDQCLCTDGYRWWFDTGIPLAQGTYTYTAPFNYLQWTGVYGEIDQATFYATLTNMGQIGVTFGGGYFYGHGLSVSGGTAEMVITSFAITQ